MITTIQEYYDTLNYLSRIDERIVNLANIGSYWMTSEDASNKMIDLMIDKRDKLQQIKSIKNKINKLNEQSQEFLHLRFVEKLSLQQIGNKYKMCPNKVRRRIIKTLKILNLKENKRV